MTAAPIRRIAISTGGGDAPGLNAVIRATVSAALRRGWECVGIRDGYNGLLVPEHFIGRAPQQVDGLLKIREVENFPGVFRRDGVLRCLFSWCWT